MRVSEPVCSFCISNYKKWREKGLMEAAQRKMENDRNFLGKNQIFQFNLLGSQNQIYHDPKSYIIVDTPF